MINPQSAFEVNRPETDMLLGQDRSSFFPGWYLDNQTDTDPATLPEDNLC